MERPPRYETASHDQFGVKAQLSEYANSLYKQFWYDNDCSEKIIIGDHQILKGGGPKVLQLYGHYKSKDFDGVHLRTEAGKYFYTKSVLATFHRCWPNMLFGTDQSTSTFKPFENKNDDHKH